MSILKTMLKQRAVYWPPLAPDKHGGPTWGTPVELRVRWEDKVKRKVGPEGEVVVLDSTVYTASDVEVGGMLMLGVLDSTVVTDDPRANAHVGEILSFEKVPNLKAKEFLRTALLKKADR